jgi:hypothetical protein
MNSSSSLIHFNRRATYDRPITMSSRRLRAASHQVEHPAQVNFELHVDCAGWGAGPDGTVSPPLLLMIRGKCGRFVCCLVDSPSAAAFFLCSALLNNCAEVQELRAPTNCLGTSGVAFTDPRGSSRQSGCVHCSQSASKAILRQWNHFFSDKAKS